MTPGQKSTKQKQYCNKFNKYFKEYAALRKKKKRLHVQSLLYDLEVQDCVVQDSIPRYLFAMEQMYQNHWAL